MLDHSRREGYSFFQLIWKPPSAAVLHCVTALLRPSFVLNLLPLNMSPVGKLFVVLNLVLAALFVGSAANLIGTSGDFRAKFEASTASAAAAATEHESALNELQARLDQASGERDRVGALKDQTVADVSALTDDLETERRQNADMRERLSQIQVALGNLEDTNRSQGQALARVTEENANLRQERNSAMTVRDDAVAASTAAMSDKDGAVRQASDLTVELRRVNERADKLDAQLQQVVAIYSVDLSDIGAQPMLEGSILSSEYVGDTGYVTINLGKKDGLQAGYTFDVYRGGTYKGRIHVETVNESVASAMVQLAGNARVTAGDRISTRL